MQKIILTKDQINDVVLENKYLINQKTKYISRCIDGRYLNEKGLPALAFPGADAGELALIAATSNTYGFKLNLQKAYQALVEIIDGAENFRMHTDDHAEKKITAGGCGHLSQIKGDLPAYQIEQGQINEINKLLTKAKKSQAQETVLHGQHLEGAILQIKGEYGVFPQYKLHAGGETLNIQVFVYHQSLVDERHRLWSKKMYENKAVELYDNCDDEYLYQAISDMAENHLFETAKRLASGMPIYLIDFDKQGGFIVQDMGKV